MAGSQCPCSPRSHDNKQQHNTPLPLRPSFTFSDSHSSPISRPSGYRFRPSKSRYRSIRILPLRYCCAPAWLWLSPAYIPLLEQCITPIFVYHRQSFDVGFSSGRDSKTRIRDASEILIAPPLRVTRKAREGLRGGIATRRDGGDQRIFYSTQHGGRRGCTRV